MSILLNLLFTFCFSWIEFNGIQTLNSPDYRDTLPYHKITINDIGLPKTHYPYPVIKHKTLSLQYSKSHKQPIWVAYELLSSHLNGSISRLNKFKNDPEIGLDINFDKNYSRSGFDRGHLVPAADMKWSVISMDESFYYSNVSPQYPSFNRGIWKVLEDKVREWATLNDRLYINIGPVFGDENHVMGIDRINIPDAFYKVILDYTNPDVKAIAFYIPHIQSNESIDKYAISVDSLEKIIGVDFFSNLPDNQEEIIERELCLKCWFDQPSLSHSKSQNSDDEVRLDDSKLNKIIHLGPKGGRYYINSKGNKVYLKK